MCAIPSYTRENKVMDEKAAIISSENDKIRAYLPGELPRPHQVVLSERVAEISPDEIIKILLAVKNYHAFNTYNDPYGEHDYGEIELGDIKYCWKFDYYDKDLATFKENGIRVLTIMEASEF